MTARRYIFAYLEVLLLLVHSSHLVSPSTADVVFPEWTIPDSNCTTPDQSTGICKSIYSCPLIVDFLKSARKPLSTADRNLLLRYQCGFDKTDVKVCCPGIRSQTGGGGGSVDNIDITHHRNIHLIPRETCGVVQTGNKILFGNTTALFEFPWMALLRYSKNNRDVGFQCGGTLINDRYILTAAHCITNLGRKTLTTVRLGEYNIKLEQDCETHPEGETYCADPVQDFTVEETIPHPKFNNPRLMNDIALLRLNRNANDSVDSVKPVCLPFAASLRNSDLINGTVTGWGRTTTSQHSDVLLQVELPIMQHSECNSRYSKIIAISDMQFCAGGEKKDSCNGDSGGPLQIVKEYAPDQRYVQYGIVSFGPDPCSTRGLPGVYTKVTKYLSWILDNIKP